MAGSEDAHFPVRRTSKETCDLQRKDVFKGATQGVHHVVGDGVAYLVARVACNTIVLQHLLTKS